LCDELERKIKVCSSTLNIICPNCKKTCAFAEALEYDFKCPDCGSILEENKVDTKKNEEKLKIYRYWLEKIKKFAKEEESFDIEEIIKRKTN
jgi:transcription initiation factor IIE alpha subunit